MPLMLAMPLPRRSFDADYDAAFSLLLSPLMPHYAAANIFAMARCHDAAAMLYG